MQQVEIEVENANARRAGATNGTIVEGAFGQTSCASGGELAARLPANSLAQRADRHASDILDAPRPKPLSLMDGFVPLKTCSEYVEQDCAVAFPMFRPHAPSLVRAGCEVRSMSLSATYLSICLDSIRA